MLSNPQLGKSQLGNIQVLRCCAALAVVWHHAVYALEIPFGLAPPPIAGVIGGAGVDVFFVVSGFIMVHATRDGARTPMEFWTDRVVRIAPLYWLALGLIIVLYACGFTPVGVSKIDLQDVATNIAFLPDIRADGSRLPIVVAGWTLVYEMFFYLLFGLTFWMRSQALQVAALTGFFLLAWLVLSSVGDLPYALHVYVQPITLEFAAGGALALLFQRRWSMSPVAGRFCGYGLVGLGVLGLIVASAMWGRRLEIDLVLRAFAWGAPAVLIVGGALVLERTGAVSTSRGALFLGAASYAIYLFHQVVLDYVARAFAFLPDTLAFAVMTGAVASAAAVYFGVIVHRRVETPFTAALRSRLRTRRARRLDRHLAA